MTADFLCDIMSIGIKWGMGEL